MITGFTRNIIYNGDSFISNHLFVYWIRNNISYNLWEHQCTCTFGIQDLLLIFIRSRLGRQHSITIHQMLSSSYVYSTEFSLRPTCLQWRKKTGIEHGPPKTNAWSTSDVWSCLWNHWMKLSMCWIYTWSSSRTNHAVQGFCKWSYEFARSREWIFLKKRLHLMYVI